MGEGQTVALCELKGLGFQVFSVHSFLADATQFSEKEDPNWSSLALFERHRFQEKISFGGIANSSSIDISAIFDYMGAFLRNGFAHVDNVILVIITWLLPSRLQGHKPHRNSPEPSEPQHTPEPSGTFRNPPP